MTAGTKPRAAGLVRRGPLRALWGPGVLDRLGAELARLNVRRGLLVCGSTLGGDRAVLARVLGAAGGRITDVYAGVEAHSPIASVETGVQVMRAHSCDAIIALGGGSVLVTARAMAVLLAEDAPLRDLVTYRAPDGRFVSPRLNTPKVPIVVLPTTPTTAVPGAATAVTVPGEDGRLAMFDPKTRAASILIDPTLLDTAPAAVVRSAAFNSLAMSVEGLVSARANPFSDAWHIHSLRLHARHVPLIDAGGADRVTMVLASMMCAEGADLSGVGLTAALSHVIGHRFHASNGDVDVVVLPHVLDFVASDENVGRRLAGACEAAGIGDVPTMLANLRTPVSLRSLGVGEQDLDAIAAAAATDFAFSTSPRHVRIEDAVAVLRAAL
ncbi:iron-containing alcohol dehydrogenase family protein [Dactylosporangium sp. CA-152071]|uniref:iron-containing alcohol dehydrogenase family protein n=1 Tax=Dactylosporangium sp. CA-152071 TaxID=3239933 RepID=UPI003D8FA8E8